MRGKSELLECRQIGRPPGRRALGQFVLLLGCCCSAVDARAFSPDDLNEYLARIEAPAADEIFYEDRVEDFTLDPVGAVCSEDSGIRVCRTSDTGTVVSFSIINRGSPRIVPPGQNLERSYRMRYAEQSLNNAKMMITEISRPSGKASHIFMRSSLYFFPRRVLPTLQRIKPNPDMEALELRLPTGERVCFDSVTKEILGGVLRENAPMDTNPDRFSRRFARVSYTGRGVMVRVDQRGNTPEQTEVWGVKKLATVTFGKRSCRVSPSLLWEQNSGWFRFHFATDTAFYEVIKKVCRWSQARLPIELPDDPSVCERALQPAAKGREKK